MNNQPRPNSDQESQEQIDQTVELLESLNHLERQQSLDAEQQSIVELATAARASVATQLPESNQALRRQLIEALGNEPPAIVSPQAVSALPIKRLATAAALMVGLGLSGWCLTGTDAPNFLPSEVAFKAPTLKAEAKIKEVETFKKKTSVANEETINFLSDDLLDAASVSDGDDSSRPAVQLPGLAAPSTSTVVPVPDGGTVLMGGIKRNGRRNSVRFRTKTFAGDEVAKSGGQGENQSKWGLLQQLAGEKSKPSSSSPREPESRLYSLPSLDASAGKEPISLKQRFHRYERYRSDETLARMNAEQRAHPRPKIVPRLVEIVPRPAEFLSGGEIPISQLSEGQSGERYVCIHENAFTNATGSDAVSTFSIDVDTASYANTRRFLNSGQLPPPDAVRIEELINYFPYQYDQPEGADPFSVDLELAACPWHPKHKLVRVGIKGKEVAVDKRKPTHLVFLLDVSGSMNSADKLPLLKRGFKMMVDQLNENDRVTIVTYAGQAGLALPPTSGDQKSKINQAIDVLTPGGSTHGSAGINLAYQLAQENFVQEGNNKVILATDGDLNVGVTADKPLVDLIKQKASEGVFLTVLGFGTGNLQDAKLEQLADNGNGMYCYIDSVREARKVLVEQMIGSLVTIAKDVKIQIEFNPSEVHSYRLIGYENRKLAAADFNNDRKVAGEIGAGHTVTAIYEIVTSDQADKTDSASTEPTTLKYQTKAFSNETKSPVRVDSKLTEAASSGELLTLAMRYKQPDSNTSKRIEFALANEAVRFDQASDDFRFATSVAAYGMLLRRSEHAANATMEMVEETAAGSMGPDVQGYRAEFIDLVRKAKTLRK